MEIAQLHTQTSATVATLQSAITQLSQLHVLPPSYAARPPIQYRNPPPIITQFNAASQCQPHSAPAQGNWQPRRPPPMREQVLDRVAAIPQRPNSNEGKQQHKADIDAWHAAHGVEAMPSLSRPYLITPGTALPGSGECFECGMITEPRHTSGSCEAKSCLPPLETKWRAIVAGALCHNPPQAQPVPVQYMWSYPYAQPTYHQTQVPVMMVDASDDNGLQDAAYWGNNQENEWETENNQGLQQYASPP